MTRLQIDTAFWVAVVTGAFLMVLGFVLAVPISVLLGEPALAPIIAVLSLTFVVVVATSVQLALLRRDMRFRSLAMRRLVAVAVGGIVGVGRGLPGLWAPGRWSPSRSRTASCRCSCCGLSVRGDRAFSGRGTDFRELFGFGINIVGSDVLNFLSRNSDNLLVGALSALGRSACTPSATRSSTRPRRCSSTPRASSPFRSSRASSTIASAPGAPMVA